MKQGARAVWAAGDYSALAVKIESVADAVIDRVVLAPGLELLDVATGTGNVALPAAAKGARVTGLDLTPELLAIARERAAAAGLEVEFIEGDAEALPFADESFDRVTSVFGAIFAPRHEVVAAELARVVRPGGSVTMTAWASHGFVGGMFGVMGKYMPPPPEGAGSPAAWGDEDHVRELLGANGLEVAIDSQEVPFTFDSIDSAVDLYTQVFGPLVMARPALEESGSWEPLIAELRALLEVTATPVDGGIAVSSSYLLAHATRPA
jgi:SAM-dependent methyltransferase